LSLVALIVAHLGSYPILIPVVKYYSSGYLLSYLDNAHFTIYQATTINTGHIRYCSI
jgi:hypothetical protein